MFEASACRAQGASPAFPTLTKRAAAKSSVSHTYAKPTPNPFVFHTCAKKNDWSLPKRGLKGTYVAMKPFHPDACVTEQVFRFNNWATKENPLNDTDRLMLAVSQVGGRRLTYAELTGKVKVAEAS